MSGGGKSASKRQIYDYLLSLDFGICHGPLTSINEVTVKDRPIWTGPVTVNTSVVIDLPDVFGGDEAEGGAFGALDIYLGTADQYLSGPQAARAGTVPADTPGYRGLAHVFFRGEKSVANMTSGFLAAVSEAFDEGFGFRWTSNNPYLPSTSIHATRDPASGLGSATSIAASVGLESSADAADWVSSTGKLDRAAMPDANPAHILYEILTNTVWGHGESPSVIDSTSFLAAAGRLVSERFGLSLVFRLEDSVEGFTQEILDHIRGVQYQDPRTGKWKLRLIRDDYDIDDEDLRRLDPSTCDLMSIKTRTWGEVINQVRVVYTNPLNEEPESVVAENSSVIAIQGRTVSDTREYLGIRNKYLAQWVAQRDVLDSSRLTTAVRLSVDRSGFDLEPGDVVVFYWPDENIERMALRVNMVDWGSATDRTIEIDCTEDAYALTTFTATDSQEPENLIPDDSPQPLDNLVVMNAPLPFLTTNGFTVAEVDAADPQVGVMFLGNSSGSAIIDIQADSDVIQGNGSTQTAQVSRFPPTRTSLLGQDLVREATSVLPAGLVEGLLRENGSSGDIFILGSGATDHEVVMLDTYNGGTGEWTLLRGIWDTVPNVWASTDRLWVLPLSTSNVDSRETYVDDALAYQFRPRTTQGRLALNLAPVVPYIPGTRQFQPFRPADVEISGNGFNLTAYLGGTVPATFDVTWANRNRTAEDTVVRRWTDGNVTPEAGQTTTIRLRDKVTGVLDFEYTGLTGTSFTATTDDFTTFRFYDLEVIAVRDGFESFQASVVDLEIERLGYGNNYGYDYGENDGG